MVKNTLLESKVGDALLVLLVGLILLVAGVRMWRNPEGSLPESSFMYHSIYWMWYPWRLKKSQNAPKLTRQQVKTYALVEMIVGFLIMLWGLILLLVMLSMV